MAPSVQCVGVGVGATVATVAVLVSLLHRWKRRPGTWYSGMCDTFEGVMGTRRPDEFKDLVMEEGSTEDGERYGAWWPPAYEPKAAMAAMSTGKLWIILPGGMNHGDAFYAWKAVASGMFGDDPWVIFHNPGIITKNRTHPPCGLTDTQYLEQFVSVVKVFLRLLFVSFCPHAFALENVTVDKAHARFIASFIRACARGRLILCRNPRWLTSAALC